MHDPAASPAFHAAAHGRPLIPPALLYRYYWLKLRQLSEAASAGDGEDEAMQDGGEPGGGLPQPGWGARLQDVAAYLRALGLEVRKGGGNVRAGCGCAAGTDGQLLNDCACSATLLPGLTLPSSGPRPCSARQAVSEEAFAAVVCRHLREHLEERTHVSGWLLGGHGDCIGGAQQPGRC